MEAGRKTRGMANGSRARVAVEAAGINREEYGKEGAAAAMRQRGRPVPGGLVQAIEQIVCQR